MHAGGVVERVVSSEEGQRWRLLQLLGDLVDEEIHVLLIPGDKLILILVLDTQAALAEGDDAESGVLVTTSGVDNVLEQTASLSEEGLCSLLRVGVGTDTVDDENSLQVAAVGQQVHAGHGSTLLVSGDGDVQHSLACLITDHADEVEGSGSVVETQLEGEENKAGLGSNLHDRD
jgi:hypothetical protein